MVSLSEVTARNVGKAAASVVQPVGLGRGTLVTRDLATTRRMLEELLGMECAAVSPDRLIARDRADRGAGSYWVLEVREVASVDRPQKLHNHWGFMMETREAVERAHALAAANAESWRLQRVHPAKGNHGSFSFYFEDADSNWWEIECRDEEISYAASVAAGDPP